MSDDKRLRDKLDKLAAEDAAGAPRRLRAGPDGSLARAILEEIDETILPRTLAFRAPDASTLSLEVANRRLLGIVQDPAARGELPGLLPPDDDAALAAVAEALARFADDAGELTVTAGPLARATGPGGFGRSAAALAQALGLRMYDAPRPVAAPDPAQGFEAGLAKLAQAVAEVSGSDPHAPSGPDAEAVGRLAALGGEALARIAEGLGPEALRAGRFLLLAAGDEALCLGQKAAGRAVVALLPADHAGAVAALWE
ncbi:MAG: hypothetical protein MUF63_17495, partial [Rhodobacteraceae bacterium]|nr:hypothetical protein [Paracoccaceae bacterium]